MKKSLENYLIKKFPKLYDTSDSDRLFTQFGFECNDGWFRLLLWTSRYLQSYIDQQNEWSKKYPDKYMPVEQVKVLQIKEKFATLRIYTQGGNQHTHSIISFVEYISGFICEFTGNMDDVGFNTKGWLKTTHISKTVDVENFKYVDDEELRSILKEIK